MWLNPAAWPRQRCWLSGALSRTPSRGADREINGRTARELGVVDHPKVAPALFSDLLMLSIDRAGQAGAEAPVLADPGGCRA